MTTEEEEGEMIGINRDPSSFSCLVLETIYYL